MISPPATADRTHKQREINCTFLLIFHANGRRGKRKFEKFAPYPCSTPIFRAFSPILPLLEVLTTPVKADFEPEADRSKAIERAV